MRENHSSPSRWRRRLIGEPRVFVGAIWSAIGIAWFLLAAFDEPSTTRLVLGSLWASIGVLIVVLAVRDRKLHRGYYAPRSARKDDDLRPVA